MRVKLIRLRDLTTVTAAHDHLQPAGGHLAVIAIAEARMGIERIRIKLPSFAPPVVPIHVIDQPGEFIRPENVGKWLVKDGSEVRCHLVQPIHSILHRLESFVFPLPSKSVSLEMRGGRSSKGSCSSDGERGSAVDGRRRVSHLDPRRSVRCLKLDLLCSSSPPHILRTSLSRGRGSIIHSWLTPLSRNDPRHCPSGRELSQ